MIYHLYILKCADKTLYTGITTDLKRRVGEHNSPTSSKTSKGRPLRSFGARYTLSRRPVKLVYSRRFRNRSAASREETRIKSLKRVHKLELINKNRVD